MDERVTSLLERVFMFLEDGEWQKADEYCERVLDIDPQNAKAYLGKLMAEYRVNKLSSLKNCKRPIEKSKNYKKILNFGDKKLIDDLISANETFKNYSSIKKQNMKKVLKIVVFACVVIVPIASVVSSIVSSFNRKKALDYTARGVGETIIFGEYDIDKDNKKEEIEWIILKKQDDKIFVISKYAIDQRTYHNSPEDVVWEKCTLRKWLNSDFMNNAFSDEQKSKIVKTLNKNPGYYSNDIYKNGGNDTKDSVFILNTVEAEKYLYILKENRMKIPFRVYFDNRYYLAEYGFNWLRSPGFNDLSAAYMGNSKYDKTVYWADTGKGVCDKTVFVRPAMWIFVG